MNPDSFDAPTLEDLAPLFPNYSIDAFIAQGGMGAVYLATQTSLERQVAIKILPRQFGADKEFRKSFAAEAKAMAKLNHPNLIGVYDFGEVDGMPFIVMEYVAGKPLHDSAYGKQIDPAEAARIVMETCHGLHHAHEHDILHRDVKPANILLDPRHAVPKLGDFGLAMATSDASDEGLIYGTPGYAAPEVYEGHPDARSDVFAAAVILYQLVTGQMPDNPYQHPSTLADCDRRYDELLAKALQPDPAERHQSALEFANELKDIQAAPVATATPVANPVIAASPVTTLPPTQKSGLGPIIATLAAVLVIAGGYFFVNSNKPSDEAKTTGKNEATLPSREITITDADISQKKEVIPTEVDPPVVKAPVKELAKVKPEKKKVRKKPRKKPPAVAKRPKAAPKPKTSPPEKAPPVSTFDHLAFLKRGRDYCMDKSNRALVKHQADLIKNIDRLERDGKTILRRYEYLSKDDERARRNAIEATTEIFEKAGRLPDDLITAVPESFRKLSFSSAEVKEALLEAFAEQKQLETELQEELAPLVEVYANGVDKQAQALSSEGNDYDAGILTQEAEQVRESFAYFLEILHGKNPLPEALTSDPTQQSLQEVFVGRWQSEEGTSIFLLKDNGSARCKTPPQKGSWKAVGEQVVINWGTHEDVLTMVPQSVDRFLARFGGDGRLVYFTRLGKSASRSDVK